MQIFAKLRFISSISLIGMTSNVTPSLELSKFPKKMIFLWDP